MHARAQLAKARGADSFIVRMDALGRSSRTSSCRRSWPRSSPAEWDAKFENWQHQRRPGGGEHNVPADLPGGMEVPISQS
jgi:hypothetical protein